MKGIHSLESVIESFASVHSQKPPTAMGWESIPGLHETNRDVFCDLQCREREKEEDRDEGGGGERVSHHCSLCNLIIDPPGSHLNVYAHSATSRNCVMG